jgi:diguanylate cyclase (GGDEF)-like protein
LSTMTRIIPSGPTSPNATDQPAWRVILVGRTGLDQALRRDAGFELIRARDTLDALGELSDPIDESSPRRCVVVVSADAEPAGEELTNFLSALRRVDPQVRLVRVGDARPGYDACVGHQADAPALRRVLDTLRPQTVPAPAPALKVTPAEPPTATPMPQPAAQAPRAATPAPLPVEEDPHERAIRGSSMAVPPVHAPSDDAALVRALLAGRSVLEPALDLARLRAGRHDLRFDHATGRLVCDDASWSMGSGTESLAALSAWMSAWAKLDAQHRELREAAFTDPLTGAWNRRYFNRFMEAALDQARRARRPLTLMVFDIDDFKKYNDTYGHAAGDEILTETVRLLTSVIRPSDRVCRVGGDEFAVIFYEPQGPRQADSTPPDSVYAIATRFQKQICGHRFPKLAQEAAGTLTISGGLATFPWDGSDAATLLDRADQLSMASKKQGKNALTFGRGAEQVCRRTD